MKTTSQVYLFLLNDESIIFIYPVNGALQIPKEHYTRSRLQEKKISDAAKKYFPHIFPCRTTHITKNGQLCPLLNLVQYVPHDIISNRTNTNKQKITWDPYYKAMAKRVIKMTVTWFWNSEQEITLGNLFLPKWHFSLC